MMLVVAVVAILLAVGSTFWRRQRYQGAAALHAILEEEARNERRFWFEDSGRVQTLNAPNPEIIAKYHAELKQKYENAASHPWLIVEPDPPIPGQ